MIKQNINIPEMLLVGISIPETNIDRGQLFRIEIGISFKQKMVSLIEKLKKEYKKYGFASLPPYKNKSIFSRLIKPKTVQDYLAKNQIPIKEMSRFYVVCQKNGLLRMQPINKLTSLTEQELRIIEIFILMNGK